MGREVSFFEVTVNALNTLTHVMVGFVSVYMCYVAYSRGYSNISMHVLLCALGVCSQLIFFFFYRKIIFLNEKKFYSQYQLLMAEGIVILHIVNEKTYKFYKNCKLQEF